MLDRGFLKLDHNAKSIRAIIKMNPHFNIQVIHSSAIFKTCFEKYLTKKSPDDLSILSIEKKITKSYAYREG